MTGQDCHCCDVCGMDVRFEFHVDAKLWHDVTGSLQYEPNNPYDGGEGYWCLHCFTIAAAKLGITSFTIEDVVI